MFTGISNDTLDVSGLLFLDCGGAIGQPPQIPLAEDSTNCCAHLHIKKVILYKMG
jgi:hypothetical protein